MSYQWRIDASDSKAREQGLAKGIKCSNDESEYKDFDCTDITTGAITVVERDLTKFRFYPQPQAKEQYGTILLITCTDLIDTKFNQTAKLSVSPKLCRELPSHPMRP